jgi:hypothetical protein
LIRAALHGPDRDLSDAAERVNGAAVPADLETAGALVGDLHRLEHGSLDGDDHLGANLRGDAAMDEMQVGRRSALLEGLHLRDEMGRPVQGACGMKQAHRELLA